MCSTAPSTYGRIVDADVWETPLRPSVEELFGNGPDLSLRAGESIDSFTGISRIRLESKEHLDMIDNTQHDASDEFKAASERDLVGWRLLSVQFCLLLGLLLSMMESSIVATALITIAETFDNYITVQWVVLAYLLAYMGFSVIVARLSDVFGRKWIVVVSLTIFGVFSLACGLSQSLIQLIVFRALQGIGGAGLYSMCMITILEITPMKRFAAISAAIGITIACASSLGPLVGGAITKAGHWRWIFLLNVPLCVLIIVLLLTIWRESLRIEGRLSIKQIDYLGAVLLLGASVLIVFALQEGGATTYAWNSSVIVAAFVVGICCAVTLVVWTWATYRRGEQSGIRSILPWTILTSRVLMGVIISTLITGYCFLSTLIELPQRFQIVNSNNPITAGVHLLPLVLASALGSLLGGILNSKRDNTFYTLNIASALILLGSGLMSILPVGSKISPAQYGYQFIFGLGCGLTFSTATVMTAKFTEPEDRAAAQGAVAQARILGGSIGLAIVTIVLNHNFTKNLSSVLTTHQLSNLRQSLSTLSQLQPMQQIEVIKVFARSFNDQLRICTYVAAFGMVASLSTWSRRKADVKEDGGEKVGIVAEEV